METFDLVVIGSGAGLSVLNTGLNMGLKCALAENSKLGGTCLNRGCIPSKVLVYPADMIREAERAQKVGLEYSLKFLDWELISKRMWSQIDQNKHIEEELKHIPNLKVYRGNGEFTGKYGIQVRALEDESIVEKFNGKRFVISSGARSYIPPIDGLEETEYVTSESFFGDKFPKKPWKSLIIIGGGVIAAEFSHMFSAFGTKVTIVEMLPRLLSTEEPEISEFVELNFKKHMDVYTNHRAITASVKKGLKRVLIKNVQSGEEKEIEAEEILIATGLKSNADILKVENAGVETDDRGWIKTNEFLETNVENIWCLGDANGKYQFRHKANYESDICTNNIFGDEKKKTDYSSVPWAIYTHPQIGHVGMTEEQAIEAGHEIYVAKRHYSYIAKGFAMGFVEGDIDDGFVKLVVDKSYKIRGAHVVGPHAALLVQPFVYLMNSGFACNFAEEDSDDLIPNVMGACPEGGTFMPIYHSMVIHPSLNEVTGWAIGALRPVNIKARDHHHH
ncbi:MAG: dihydrolipoyl dehydrogenase family protein [Promethearchaeota archaeon]